MVMEMMMMMMCYNNSAGVTYNKLSEMYKNMFQHTLYRKCFTKLNLYLQEMRIKTREKVIVCIPNPNRNQVHVHNLGWTLYHCLRIKQY